MRIKKLPKSRNVETPSQYSNFLAKSNGPPSIKGDRQRTQMTKILKDVSTQYKKYTNRTVIRKKAK